MQAGAVSRVERSRGQLGRVTVFPDGRKPTYAALLDLDSKPFWRASEAPGVEALVADLCEQRAALLAEAMGLRPHAVTKELESSLGSWSVLAVSENGMWLLSAERAPVLRGVLGRHCDTVLTTALFASCMLSFLEAGGALAPHYGPSNLRLRLQFPLSLPQGCRLVCGGEQSRYEEGYALMDDSYLHWAEHGGEHAVRAMLVVDVWHPGVTGEERRELGEAMRSF
jgi:hypothetical protein